MPADDLKGTLKRAYDGALQPFNALSWRINPATIKPETLAGACAAVLNTLSCLGLAENEHQPEPQFGIAIPQMA